MAARTVTINISGTSKQLQAALAEAGLAADESGKHIGDSMDSASTKAGGAFSKPRVKSTKKSREPLNSMIAVSAGAPFVIRRCRTSSWSP